MTAFLSLPQEVRDVILGFAIPARIAAPRSLADLEAQKIQVPVGRRVHLCSEHPAEKHRTAVSLLLVNKQIHYDIKELLKLRGGYSYELDVKLLYESLLVPTWIYLPLPTDIVPLVRVTIQSLEKFRQVGEFRGEQVLDPQGQTCGRGPPYVNDLYCLLLDILCWNPTIQLHGKSSGGKGLAIRVLEIDCIDPENKDLLAPESKDPRDFAVLHMHANNLGALPNHEDVEGLVRPEWLAAGISEHLLNRLLHGYYIAITGRNHYQPYFYSRIGQIFIKSNGKLVGNLDVGQILASIRFSPGGATPYPVENIIDHWIMWKEKAMQGRKDRGFEMSEPPSNWKEKTRADNHYRPERKSFDEAIISRLELVSPLDFI